jgi:ABC-2 type transport system permease protein
MLERWRLSKAQLVQMPSVDARLRVLYNPNLEDRRFMAISEFLAVVIAMVGMLLPAASAVYEKEYGHLEGLMATPVRVWEIMAAKVLANGLIMLGCAAVGAYVGVELFCQVPLAGSMGYFLLVTAIFLFTATGFGLLIATLAETLAEAVLLIIFILTPMWFLSGAWTPVEMMPAALQKLMYLSPLTYYIEIGYGIFLRGAGLRETWQPLAQLAALGIAVFVFGAYRYRRHFR